MWVSLAHGMADPRRKRRVWSNAYADTKLVQDSQNLTVPTNMHLA